MAETATAALFSMLSMLLVGREIGPQAMGVATIALSAFLLLDLLAASVFTDALVQHPRLRPAHAGSAAAACALAGVAAAVALVAAAPLLAVVSGAPEVAVLARALAPLLPLSAWSGAMAGLVLRRQRFGLLAARAMLGQPVALAIGLLATAEGFGPWAVIANQAAATLATFALLLLLARREAGLRLDRAALRELWPVAGPQIAAVFVSAGRYRLFLLALGFTASGHAVVALSHAAFRLLDGALGVVFQSVARIGLPRLCAERANRARLAEAFGELAQFQALLGLPVTVGVALVAPAMVHVLLGPEWREAGNAARVVGLATAVGFLAGDAGSLFVALGKARRNLILAAASLAAPLALLLVLRPSTPAGVALCWASPSVLLPPVAAWLALRELGRSPRWLLEKTAPALLATGCMAAAVLALQASVPMRLAAELAVSAACGGAVYLAVAAAALRLRPPPALAPRPVVLAAE